MDVGGLKPQSCCSRCGCELDVSSGVAVVASAASEGEVYAAQGGCPPCPGIDDTLPPSADKSQPATHQDEGSHSKGTSGGPGS